VPVGDFFGAGLCEVASFASRYFGTSSGGFFCKWPMPFRASFRVELENLDPEIDTEDTLNASVAMYRVHESDAIHFKEPSKFAFVNPWAAERLRPFSFSSVAYLYLDTPEGQGAPIPAAKELLCWYRIRNTDHQSIP